MKQVKTILKTSIVITVSLFAIFASAQKTEVQIHQINVGNGDGALVLLYDNDVLVYTMVIDGGLKASSNDFVPYLKQFLPDMAGQPLGTKNIDWVILSHNHQDHFNGLIEMFKDDKFIIRKITDQGGYTIGADNFSPLPPKKAANSNCVPFITLSKSKKNPQQALINYVSAVATANTRSKPVIGGDIARETVFDTTAKTFQSVTLANVGGVPVTMTCIATNAFTRTTTGATARDIGSTNPNNFSYGWILSFGQFRFYTGGDLGGYSGGYTDQETPMATYIKATYASNHPLTRDSSLTFPGHVCVMKTNHHGSTQSSNPDFLEALAYSAIVTSAGSHRRWKIPTVPFVDRVAGAPAFGTKQGIYFTQLYNYGGDKALDEANKKFKGKAGYNYVEPGKKNTGQYSYVFIVKRTNTYVAPGYNRPVDITLASMFEVKKVKTSDFSITDQYIFLCHKP